MEFGGELGVSVVATAVEDGDGDAVFDHCAEEGFIALLDFLEREVHLAEAIVAMVVCAGDPDDQIGREGVEGVCKGVEKLLEVHFTFDVANGFDIMGGGDFFCGIIFSDVDGVGVDVGVTCEDGGGAVALVCVCIDNHDFDARLFVLKIADGDGNVVEDAVAFSVFPEGVVGAAGEAYADALYESGMAGEASGFNFGGGAGKEFRRGGEAEEELLFAIEGGGLDFSDVIFFVDAEDAVEIGGCDFGDFLGTENFFCEEHVFGNPKFIHGEGVARGEWHFKRGGIETSHRIELSVARVKFKEVQWR